jgi:hypothetical protein
LFAFPKFADKVDVVAVLHLQETIEGAWCRVFRPLQSVL